MRSRRDASGARLSRVIISYAATPPTPSARPTAPPSHAHFALVPIAVAPFVPSGPTTAFSHGAAVGCGTTTASRALAEALEDTGGRPASALPARRSPVQSRRAARPPRLLATVMAASMGRLD